MTDEQALAVLDAVADVLTGRVKRYNDRVTKNCIAGNQSHPETLIKQARARDLADHFTAARAHIAARLSEQGAKGGGVEGGDFSSLMLCPDHGKIWVRGCKACDDDLEMLAAMDMPPTDAVCFNCEESTAKCACISAPPAAAVEGDLVKLCHDGQPCQNIYGKPADSAGVTEAEVELTAIRMWNAANKYGPEYAHQTERTKDELRVMARAALSAARGE
jgi:hypothetical protein